MERRQDVPLNYKNLDEETRQFMLQEIDLDVERGNLHISPLLNEHGAQNYTVLLRKASEGHNDAWLANELRHQRCIKAYRRRRKPKGGFRRVKVPVIAHETLAEGEFNRFYARALCIRAIEKGITEVQVYRGKTVRNPRPKSQAMIGRMISAKALLEDLRQSPGVEPALGLPAGPNSGLTISLPDSQEQPNEGTL
jgi:hypothetical protein